MYVRACVRTYVVPSGSLVCAWELDWIDRLQDIPDENGQATGQFTSLSKVYVLAVVVLVWYRGVRVY